MVHFIVLAGANLAAVAVLVALVVIPVRIWDWYKGNTRPL